MSLLQDIRDEFQESCHVTPLLHCDTVLWNLSLNPKIESIERNITTDDSHSMTKVFLVIFGVVRRNSE